MNPIVKKLAERAGLEFDDDLVLETEAIYFITQTNLEKFAKLIALECARVVKASSPAGMIAVNAIRIHFGVEP
jgi:hypothetical protein